MATPQIVSKTCWLLACVDCGLDWVEGFYDGMTPHWDSAEEAEKQAIEDLGFSRDGETLRCAECSAIRKCAAEGHRYENWRPVGGHSNQQVRVCRRCDEVEVRPMATAVLPGDEVPF